MWEGHMLCHVILACFCQRWASRHLGPAFGATTWMHSLSFLGTYFIERLNKAAISTAVKRLLIAITVMLGMLWSLRTFSTRLKGGAWLGLSARPNYQVSTQLLKGMHGLRWQAQITICLEACSSATDLNPETAACIVAWPASMAIAAPGISMPALGCIYACNNEETGTRWDEIVWNGRKCIRLYL